MTKKKAAPASKGKPASHTRKATNSEIQRIEKGRRLAVNYLEQRDGMDPQLALDIVESMSTEDVNTLIEEANTAVIERTNTTAPGNAPPSDDIIRDFTEFPGLAALEVEFEDGTKLTLPELMFRCIENSSTKNSAETKYKADKEFIVAAMREDGADQPFQVGCLGVKLALYKGHTPRTLDELKLIEKGVDPKIISECWKSTAYWDVRITPPKE